MKSNKKVKVIAMAMMALTLITTAAVAVNEKKEAKAANYFQRVSVKNCDIQLEAGTLPWTGSAVCPKATVKYNGKELELGVDYIVKYKNNVNSGVAKAIIKGKGEDFKGKKVVEFYIKGINIADECTVKVENFSYRNNKTFNDKVYLYHNDEIVPESNYKVSIVKTKEKQEDGVFLEHYIVTTKYIISGKGKYDGILIYEQKGVYKKISERTYKLIDKIVDFVVEVTLDDVDSIVEEESTGAVEVLPEDTVLINE